MDATDTDLKNTDSTNTNSNNTDPNNTDSNNTDSKNLELDNITQTKLTWSSAYRIIPSCFPPINFFENMVSPDLMDAAFVLESRTNDRLRNEVGEIALVPHEERIVGGGASPIMAAFTHIGKESRFTDGNNFGIFYAARTKQTAIVETCYHRARFLSFTNEEPGVTSMRCYATKPLKSMVDIRNGYSELHNPNSYIASQAFGWQMKQQQRHGIIYSSVRHPGHDCIAVLKPKAIGLCKQSTHYEYHWNGEKIEHVIEKIKVKLP
ncbi:MAG: RES family NAD+ phosphorylase [Kangiellaceae bacterium]|nr:RES family NAD+ phosphorylase [Kangiellaceae bacterium]